jgi:hypothetical protein
MIFLDNYLKRGIFLFKESLHQNHYKNNQTLIQDMKVELEVSHMYQVIGPHIFIYQVYNNYPLL